MSTQDRKPAKGQSPQSDREQRLAQALRANLRRRKAAARKDETSAGKDES
ncbi:hypothetical protein OA2633_00515 [Oceanicaulis sp. HTCC2633]|nr:hypothetical protein [Oceanicaulis sp. HTCC2633]EAP89230.1 hypothetical protein OA2633_00515 [Oceanicaulis sp. HTCC2633]